MWKVLLPWLLGAASTFPALYLVQVYLVPRTDTRARREERWEKDVLDLGELLTNSVYELSGKAYKAQLAVQLVSSGRLAPEADPDQVTGYLGKLTRDSQQATREFTELIKVRVDWISDRIIEFRTNSDRMTGFALAWSRYLLKVVVGVDAIKYGEVPESDFDAFWDSERELRAGLLSQVKALARLRHPPRASRRQQIRYVRRAIAARVKRKPVPTRPSELAAKDTETARALQTRKGTASPWHL